jgi:hypothetical protein
MLVSSRDRPDGRPTDRRLALNAADSAASSRRRQQTTIESWGLTGASAGGGQMGRREIEKLAGNGTVHAGGRCLRATRYDLSILPGDASADGGDVRVEGSIDIAGMGEAVVLAGTELTLRLEDGRHVRCTLTSTAGRIQGTLART